MIKILRKLQLIQKPITVFPVTFVSKKKMSTGSLNKRRTIGVVQMNCKADKDLNFNSASKLINRAKERGAEMVFLPEAFDFIEVNGKNSLAKCETQDGNVISGYKNIAKELSIWISLGGFHEKSNEETGRYNNTHLIINNQGNIVAQYRKVHLFDVDIKGSVVLSEKRFTVPGNEIVAPVETPFGKIGLGICYDLRFPEFSVLLAQKGAEILTFPSAFTVPTGMAHWESLLRSRAIETQCYVVAAAQVGKHEGERMSYGHSMIVDPWGCVIAECHNEPDVCVAELNFDYMKSKREGMPIWKHRRHDLYSCIATQRNSISNKDFFDFGHVKIPSKHVFYKTSLSFSFVNIKPVLPWHVLVAPVRVVSRLADLTQEEVADMFLAAQKVGSLIEKHCGCESLTQAVQDGPAAGQTIKHVHVHILPRKEGDFKVNDDIYHELERHDKNLNNSNLRSDKEMTEEAELLRKLF